MQLFPGDHQLQPPYIHNTVKNTTVVWKIFVRIYFVVKYFRVNNFRGLSIPTKIFYPRNYSYLATFLCINLFPWDYTYRTCYSYQMKADCNEDQLYTKYHIDSEAQALI